MQFFENEYNIDILLKLANKNQWNLQVNKQQGGQPVRWPEREGVLRLSRKRDRRRLLRRLRRLRLRERRLRRGRLRGPRCGGGGDGRREGQDAAAAEEVVQAKAAVQELRPGGVTEVGHWSEVTI